MLYEVLLYNRCDILSEERYQTAFSSADCSRRHASGSSQTKERHRRLYGASGKPRCTYVTPEKAASISARSSSAGGVITGHVCIYNVSQGQLLRREGGRGGPPSLLARYLTPKNTGSFVAVPCVETTPNVLAATHASREQERRTDIRRLFKRRRRIASPAVCVASRLFAAGTHGGVVGTGWT